ncbi:MAG TPA: hypothetical protein VF753_21540 [Terriglobales bacterium]
MMNILPIIIFLGSALLLFGVSNMLPDAPAAMHPRRRRIMMQAIVSLAVVGESLFIVLMPAFDQHAKDWAFATAGMVVGYWLKPR